MDLNITTSKLNKKNKSFLILVFFSLSTIQFSFTLASKREIPKRAYKIDSYPIFILDIALSTEIWSLFLIFISQDMPFFILRILILVYDDLSKNYMIYFNISKNFILILTELYRIYVIFSDEIQRKAEYLDKKESAHHHHHVAANKIDPICDNNTNVNNEENNLNT